MVSLALSPYTSSAPRLAFTVSLPEAAVMKSALLEPVMLSDWLVPRQFPPLQVMLAAKATPAPRTTIATIEVSKSTPRLFIPRDSFPYTQSRTEIILNLQLQCEASL